MPKSKKIYLCDCAKYCHGELQAVSRSSYWRHATERTTPEAELVAQFEQYLVAAHQDENLGTGSKSDDDYDMHPGPSNADEDTPQSSANAGMDTGDTSSTEADVPSVETGAPSMEADVPHVEVGTSNTEAGTSNTEAGTSNTEAGTSNMETSAPSAEADLTHAEAGTSNAEMGAPSAAADVPSTDVGSLNAGAEQPLPETRTGARAGTPDAIASQAIDITANPGADSDSIDMDAAGRAGLDADMEIDYDDEDDDFEPDPGSLAHDEANRTSDTSGAGSDARDDHDVDADEVADLDELAKLARVEEIKTSLAFTSAMREASLLDEHSKLDTHTLERLQNPLQETLNVDDPDLRLALDLFLATSNSSQDTYTAACQAISRRFPSTEIYSYDRIKRRVADLSGVNSIIHHMCINTCVAYTG
ncbi:hypothetical protein B0H21DRAFT_884896, partial [Amylocystis lapponica]